MQVPDKDTRARYLSQVNKHDNRQNQLAQLCTLQINVLQIKFEMTFESWNDALLPCYYKYTAIYLENCRR